MASVRRYPRLSTKSSQRLTGVRSRAIRGGLVPALLLGLLLVFAPGAIAVTRPDTPPESGGTKTLQDFLAFRTEFGLRIDPGFVSDVTSFDPDWGVPLTAGESTDLAQRVKVQAELGPLQASLNKLDPAIFGGLYIDQHAGGIVDIALTRDLDATSMDALVATAPSGARLRFRQVAHSWAELQGLQAAIGKFLGAGVTYVSSDVVNNTVEVSVDNNPPAALTTLLAAHRETIVERPGVLSEPTICSNRSSCIPYRAGLFIYRADSSYCTGGFMATSGQDYWLTAGHCGTVGTAFFHDQIQVGTVGIRSYVSGTNADAEGIGMPGTQHNWIYVLSTEMARTVTSRQGHNVDVVGEAVCQSGYTTGFWCGTIYNVNGDIQDNNGVVLHHMRFASFLDGAGDSGGPVFYGNQAKGLIEGQATSLYCGTYHCSIYSQIWEVEQALGVTVRTN